MFIFIFSTDVCIADKVRKVISVEIMNFEG